MTTLPAHLEALGADIDVAASRRVDGIRRRRRRQLAVVAVAALLGTTGVAAAASGFDFLGWLHGESASQPRFLVDPTRTYRGPAPAAVTWRGRTYHYVAGVPRPATDLSRSGLLRGLAASENAGAVSHDQAGRVRSQIAAVGDDFFRRFQLVLRIEGFGVSSPPAPAGFERVPPDHVPMLIVCRSGDCHALAAARGVPVHTPIYVLRPTPDWVLRRVPPEAPRQWTAVIEHVFGRPLTAAEWRLVRTLVTATGSASGGSSGPAPAPATTATPAP